ncbi:MAG: hypothetical protein PHH26_03640 [Candidatus Thermoplasmatota archaeon]|nr:hypothetical protein [Candidatus Thermoplasmatota archaeon]
MSDAGSKSKAQDEAQPLNRQWAGKIAAKPSEKLPQETPEKGARKDIISERYLEQETKEKVELQTLEECKDMEQTLYEHRWGKTSSDDISEIENKIDAILGKRPEVPKPVETRAEKKYAEPVSGSTSDKTYTVPVSAPPAWMDLPISGTIIDKRLLYKTAGGYIVEVVYRAPDGMLKTDRFSVTSVGDVEHTLDKLRQGAPVEEAPVQKTTVVAEETKLQAEAPKEEKPKKGFAVPPLFGKKKEQAAEAKPEEQRQDAAVSPEASKEGKKGIDVGGMLGKLPFGKKKEQK